MAHRYGIPIQVTTNGSGEPIAFTWRGNEYRVVSVLQVWRLRDRWWVKPVEAMHSGKSASDRWYYRVECPGFAYYEIYYDAAVNWWIMDRVLD
jgi:hypothetical protein